MRKPRKIERFISSLIVINAFGLSSIAAPMLGATSWERVATDPGWTFTGSLNTRRTNHTATLLPSGKVLVAGGNSGAVIQCLEGILNSAELYDPATGTWTPTGSLNVPRCYSTATLLPNGKVLVAGGIPNPSSVTATAELYDPVTGTWSLTGDLNTTRFWHSATLLPNGKVLIAGGHGGQDGPRHSAELYDPASGTWSVTGRLLNTGGAGRMMHTATLLQTGKVLVAGGVDGDDFEVSFSSAELYNPDTGMWSVADGLSTHRALHTGTMLPNGKVLVVGGSTISDSVELYDPATETWSHVGTLARRSIHTATLLANGQVLIAGGANLGDGGGGLNSLNSAELYQPHTGTWSNAPSLHTARNSHTATKLQNGKVLIVGGFNTNSGLLNSAELYDPGNTSPNPIDDEQFFVRQHFIDFLSREPDPSGLAFWTSEITSCGADSQCVEIKRINVSAAFFLSIEFQETGFLVYKTYGAAFGATRIGFAVPLTLSEFIPDLRRVGQGVVVGATGWQTQLESNQVAYFNEFVTRSDFLARYPTTMTSAEYIDTLNANSGGALSVSERDQLVADLTVGTKTRAQVLGAVAEDDDFTNEQFNRAFVLMQYFGYLRRNPNDAPDTGFGGYSFWLAKLDEFNGNFIQAEMVKAFLLSTEYRQRFAQP